jgi:hypothetical protein
MLHTQVEHQAQQSLAQVRFYFQTSQAEPRVQATAQSNKRPELCSGLQVKSFGLIKKAVESWQVKVGIKPQQTQLQFQAQAHCRSVPMVDQQTHKQHSTYLVFRMARGRLSWHNNRQHLWLRLA